MGLEWVKGLMWQAASLLHSICWMCNQWHTLFAENVGTKSPALPGSFWAHSTGYWRHNAGEQPNYTTRRELPQWLTIPGRLNMELESPMCNREMESKYREWFTQTNLFPAPSLSIRKISGAVTAVRPNRILCHCGCHCKALSILRHGQIYGPTVDIPQQMTLTAANSAVCWSG